MNTTFRVFSHHPPYYLLFSPVIIEESSNNKGSRRAKLAHFFQNETAFFRLKIRSYVLALCKKYRWIFL